MPLPPPPPATDTDRCPLCGQANQCTVASGDCWCFSTQISPEALARLNDEQIDTSCLCPRCAQAADSALHNLSLRPPPHRG